MRMKIITLALCMLWLCTSVLPGMAEALTPYALLDAAEEENNTCRDADEQMAVGCKYMMKLTAMAAERLDVQGLMQEQIEQVLAKAETDAQSGATALQQSAVRLYATADLLMLMTASLDDGAHQADLRAVQVMLNRTYFTVQDQQAAGAEAVYRLAAIMTEELDAEGAWASKTQAIRAVHDASAKQARGSVHHTANHLYRAAGLLGVAAMELDSTGRIRENVQGVMENLEKMDTVCVSSTHQCVNGSFRCMEMMAVLNLAMK